MKQFFHTLIILSIISETVAKRWPYERYLGELSSDGKWTVQNELREPEDGPSHGFLRWLHHIVANDPDDGPLSQTFANGSIPPHATLEELICRLNLPTEQPINEIVPPSHDASHWPDRKAKAVFSHLPYAVDPRCASDPSKW